MEGRIGVLFVCLGNICRSPAAEGTFRALVAREGLDARFDIDSAGTAAYHAGEAPNANSRRAAARHGIELVGRARQFLPADFVRFDYILTMDSQNYQDVLRSARDAGDRARVAMFRRFDPHGSKSTSGGAPDVPDPYYGGAAGFDQVQEIMNRTAIELLSHIRREHRF